jgi:hypothetical protein
MPADKSLFNNMAHASKLPRVLFSSINLFLMRFKGSISKDLLFSTAMVVGSEMLVSKLPMRTSRPDFLNKYFVCDFQE